MVAVDRTDPTTCAVCAREATGLGVCPRERRRSAIHWVCDDPECIEIAQAAFDMKQDQFTRLESLAAGGGGAAGVEFLQQIGKSDIYQMNETEWYEFCRRFVAGYRKDLKRLLKEEAPF